MAFEEEIKETLKKLERRVLKLETQINKELKIENSEEKEIIVEDDFEESNQRDIFLNSASEKEITPKEPISFTQIISFLGISGIVIGFISLFFYAIANNWISELGQVLIGVTGGLILYSFGLSFYKKNTSWANFMLGGGLFLEFLSISVGVLSFKVINEYFGFIFLIGFIILSIILSIKFESRTIAYYSLVGGFLIPILIKVSNSMFFLLFYLLILSVSLIVISNKFNWSDLRLTSFLINSIFLINYLSFYRIDPSIAGSFSISVTFLVLNFILFNISSVIFSIKNKEQINILDILTLNGNSIIFILLISNILLQKVNLITLGFIMLPISFIYLFEIYILKSFISDKDRESQKSLIYSIFSSAIISLNLALIYIINSFDLDFFIIPFMIEWVLFAFLSKNEKNKSYFTIISNIFLILVALWYVFVVRFDQGITHASLYLLILAMIPVIFVILNYFNINKEINGGLFLVSVFFFIFSFYTFLLFFISQILGQIILSILWLSYTLIVLKLVSYKKEARTLMIVLLGITLIKIAFVDLTYLSGFYRIIGFIIFGIILLLGGYFIKNEKQNN